MLPIIYVFDYAISMYWLSVVVGLLLTSGLLFLRVRSGHFRTSGYDVFIVLLLCIVGAFVGATLLNAIVRTIQNATVPGFWTWQTWISILRAGGVFYGGLIGGFFAALIYVRKRKIDFRDITDIMVPSILLFHAIGRLGCFFAGCCFGREATWGVTMGSATLIPVQLIEAGFNLLILAQMLLFRPERERLGVLFPMYLATYAVGRFFLEFMRGDMSSRGIFLLSTSQWISLLILATLAVVFLAIRKRKKQKNQKPEAVFL